MSNTTKDNDFQQIIQAVYDPVSNALGTKPSGGSLVPDAYDDIVLTYITVGNGTGQIGTVVYKNVGVQIALLTLSYDSSNRLIEVQRT